MPLALQAGFWGLLSGSALVIGALIAWFAHVPQRVIAAVMAFGSGVLISALSFELMGEAYTKSRKPEPIPREPSLLSLGVAAPSSPRQVLVNETWYEAANSAFLRVSARGLIARSMTLLSISIRPSSTKRHRPPQRESA